MASVKINVNIDAELKKEVEEVLDAMGLTMTAAINMYLKRILMEGGIPFKVTTRVPNSTTLQAIEEGQRIVENDVLSYDSVEELRADHANGLFFEE